VAPGNVNGSGWGKVEKPVLRMLSEEEGGTEANEYIQIVENWGRLGAEKAKVTCVSRPH